MVLILLHPALPLAIMAGGLAAVSPSPIVGVALGLLAFLCAFEVAATHSNWGGRG